MMTRKEAIKHITTWMYATTDLPPVQVSEAFDMAIAALRPVSREQVEKVFPGCRSCKSCRSCVFCINNLKDMPCKKCDPNKDENTRFEPCLCGGTRREWWSGPEGHKVVCLRCGLESPWVPRSKGKNGVKKVWNAMILEKRMEQING